MNQPTDPTNYPPTPNPAAAPYVPPPAQTTYRDPRRKSPFLATVLSFLPGVGQVYVGYYQRGFTHAIIFALLIGLMTFEVEPLMPLIAVLVAFFYVYNLVDAWRRASLYNYALEGGTEIDLPDDIRIPGFKGSVAGGAILVVLGIVLLSHTLFNVSLEWLEDWWPAAIIAFGAYLGYKALQERAAAE